MQQYTVYLYPQISLHVSDGISTLHQELISLYLQYLALLRPLMLPVVNVTGRELRQVAVTVSIMPDAVDTVTWAADGGWRYHPKHVEQFADRNKLYIVTYCWILLDNYWHKTELYVEVRTGTATIPWNNHMVFCFLQEIWNNLFAIRVRMARRL